MVRKGRSAAHIAFLPEIAFSERSVGRSRQWVRVGFRPESERAEPASGSSGSDPGQIWAGAQDPRSVPCRRNTYMLHGVSEGG